MASRSNSEKTRHTCEYCQKEFARKFTLNKHRKIHLIKSEFKCSFCDYVTNFKNHLNDHIRTHTKERPYKCQWPNCSAAFGQPSSLAKHQKCSHQKGDDNLEKFKCPECPYKTGAKSGYTRHLKTHPDFKEHSCDLCPYQTKRKSNLRFHHKSVHLKLKPFKCQHPNCDSAFSKKSTLNHHQLVHNKEDESLLIFECSECGYKTGRKGSLSSHLAVHSEVKPISCNLCPFRCKLKENLTRHLKHVHSTLKPFACPESTCSYSAKTKPALTNHMKVHQSFKEFGCSFPQCNFRAKKTAHLRVHEMTHRREKPFKCNFCPFKATQSSNLCVHIRRHTGEAPYPCPYCSYRGKGSDNLKHHLKRHHCQKESDAGASSKT